MAKLLTELIGTFFLVLTVGLTVIQGTPFAPLAIGTALMVMVYMGGHVSGGHYNPAVSLGVLLRRKMTAGEFGGYVGAQLVGAVLATLAVQQIVGQTFAAAPASDVDFVAPLLVEVLFTFALVLVVLNVAVSARTTGNSYYGLAIGFTVMVGAFAGGAISGGAFNPAVGLGPMLVHGLLSGGSFSAAWLYLVGPLVGGALAAVVFALQEGDAVVVVEAGAAAGAPAGD
jgi:aquaporin Z